MFASKEHTKRNTFFDKLSSEELSQDFAEKYLKQGVTKLSYPSFPNDFQRSLEFPNSPKLTSSETTLHECKFDIPEFNLPKIELPPMKIYDSSNFLLSTGSSQLKEFSIRTLEVQTSQFALYALEEGIERSKTLSNISKAVDTPNKLFGPNKLILGVTKTKLGQLSEWMNYVDLELRSLYQLATPLGKVTLPSQLMLELNHPEVLKLIEKEEYLKAKHLFAQEIKSKYFLSGPFLNKLSNVGKGMGIASAATVAYKVGTSDDKLATAEQEVVAFTGGFVAGLEAGKLALPYCSKLVHPVAKTVCQAGAVIVGSVLGTEVVNNIYDKAVNKNTQDSGKLLSNSKNLLFFNFDANATPPTQSKDTIPTLDEFFNDFQEPSI